MKHTWSEGKWTNFHLPVSKVCCRIIVTAGFVKYGRFLHCWATVSFSWNHSFCLATRDKSSSSPVQQFPENYAIVEHLVCQVANRGPRQCPWWYQPKGWHGSGLDHVFAYNVSLKCHVHAHMWFLCRLSLEFCVRRGNLQRVYLAFRKITSVVVDRLDTDVGMRTVMWMPLIITQ